MEKSRRSGREYPSLRQLVKKAEETETPKSPALGKLYPSKNPPPGNSFVAYWEGPLPGKGGIRIDHNLGHLDYQPIATVVGTALGEVGDIIFRKELVYTLVISTGTAQGRLMVAFLDLRGLKKL